MSVFQLGPIIRNRREELHLSQEDLADGICSVPTLSRIENGERMPTKNHFEMLMQRLGYSAMSLDYFTDKQDFLIHELKFKIRHAYIEKDFELSKQLLNDLEALFHDPSPIDKQFTLLYQTLLYQNNDMPENRLIALEKALLLTRPNYNSGHIPRILSYEEIIILNNIAICYDALNQRDKAIFILFALDDYYDQHIINPEEALRTRPLIIYNLSKYLGLNGDYDDCIRICNKGIEIAQNTGRCPLLGKILFNQSWAFLQRNGDGDYDSAKESLKRAYYFAFATNSLNEMKIYQQHYVSAFGERLLV